MCFLASLGAASLVALNATAQAPAPTTTPASTPAAAESTPVKLPYGAEDVLKLSRAQVSEDVILNYVHNSGTIYNLGPNDIVYLRNEGVSDRVISTMLDQRQNVPAQATARSAPTGAPVAAQAPVSPDANAAAGVPPASQYAPTYVQAAPTYVDTTPAYAPPSTLYVIPYGSTRFDYANNAYPYPYYNYSYPYYGGYYGYSGRSIGLRFGYGGGGGYRGYYGGRYGGYRGGGHYGHYGHR